MHLNVSLFLVIGVVNASWLSKRDQVYSTNTQVTTYDASLGVASTNTTINPNVYVWLSGGSTHNILGNLDNSGRLTISQTSYLATTPGAGGQTSDFVGDTATDGVFYNRNGALVSVNDYGSASAPTYDYLLYYFENRGSLQFCGRGDTGGSTYHISARLTAYNYGVIDFQQYTTNIGSAFNIQNKDLSTLSTAPNFYNYGAIRMLNVNMQVVQNFYGTGCWVIATGGTLYLQDGAATNQNPTSGSVFPGQSVYFTDVTGTLHFDTASTQVGNHNFGAQVYGFKAGNAIEFYLTITAVSYATATGILTVTFTGTNSYVNINIGTGYTASSFYQAANPQRYNTAGYNAVFYRDTVPVQSAPSVCGVTLANCGDPALTASAAFTTSTSAVVSSTSTSIATTTTSTPGATSTSTNASASATSTSASGTLPITCTCPPPSSTVYVLATS